MQTLKDDIKDAIIKSAISEFYEKGYRGANMRSIAQKADITAGNLYKYFDGKLQLFTFIVKPIFDDVKATFMAHENEITFDLAEITSELERFALTAFRKLYSAREVILILIDKSDGTQFSKAKQSIIDFIVDHLKKEHTNGDNTGNSFIINLVRPFAVSFVEGYIEILRSDKDPELSNQIAFYFSKMFIEGFKTIFWNNEYGMQKKGLDHIEDFEEKRSDT